MKMDLEDNHDDFEVKSEKFDVFSKLKQRKVEVSEQIDPPSYSITLLYKQVDLLSYR